MDTLDLSCGGVGVHVEFPGSFKPLANILLPQASDDIQPDAVCFSLRSNGDEKLSLYEKESCLARALTPQRAALMLSQEIVRSIAERYDRHIAVHAAAVVKNGLAVVIPAQTGSGKTSLSAWLVANGYDYLTDELVLFQTDTARFDAFYRPLNIKTGGIDALAGLRRDCSENSQIVTDSVTLWEAEQVGQRAGEFSGITAGIFVFPEYRENGELAIEALSPAQTGLELMASNVNARNLNGHGFGQCAALARTVPGLRLTYGGFDQIEGILPELLELVTSKAISVKLLNGLARPRMVSVAAPAPTAGPNPVPQASADSGKKKLCIGMATYDDFDGVYFSAQALRLFHPQITKDTEILVLDNNPAGRCSADLKALDKKIRNYRYVPVVEKTGTAIRDLIFEHANAEYVLCMDCHVFVDPGAIEKLIAYFDADPNCNDLLQGPMYYDDLSNLSTHFKPKWNKGMYGVWGSDERGKQPDAEPFDIPMQGLGLFACRRDAWPGFNKHFRGFGGEEGYIHEKIRQAGGRTLCLPFLRWLHRFPRPMGVPYPINWPDRIRNYLIGHTELGLDPIPVVEHFKEHVGEGLTLDTVREFEKEFGIQI